jgi:hypothetical protein
MGAPVEPLHTAMWCPAWDAVDLLANAGERDFVHRMFS